MSLVHKSLNELHLPEGKWYLRNNEGTVYGPVPMSILCEWAAQSRILPGNMVSGDNVEWVAVENLPELKMEWTANLPDGKKFGPFHFRAVPYLHESGVITSDATIINKATGKVLPVSDFLKTKAEGQTSSDTELASKKEKTYEQLYKEEKKNRLSREANLQLTMDTLKHQVDESDEELRQVRQRADQDHQELKMLEIDAHSKEQRLKESVAKLQNENKKLHDDIERAGKEKEELKFIADESTANLDRIKVQLSDEQKKTASLQKQILEKENKLMAEINKIRSTLVKQFEESEAKALRLEKQLESMNVLQSELEKGGSDKDIAAMRDAKNARNSLAQLEFQLQAEQKDKAGLQEQMARKEKEFESRISMLSRQVEEANHAVDKFKGDIHSRDESIINLTNLAQTRENDLTSTRNQLKQLEEHYEKLKEEAKSQLDGMERNTEEVQNLHKALNDARQKHEEERSRLEQRIEEQRAETDGSLSKIKKMEKELAEKTREHQELSRQVSLRETNLNDTIAQLKKKMEASAAEMEQFRKKVAAETEKSEAARKQFAEKEQKLSRELQEAREQAKSQKQQYEFMIAKERDQEKTLINKVAVMKSNIESDSSLIAQASQRLQDSERTHSEAESRLRDEVKELHAGAEKLAQENNSLRTALDKAQSEITRIRAEQEEHLSALSSKSAFSMSDHTEAESKLKDEIKRLNDLIAAKEGALTVKENAVNELQRSLENAKKQMEDSVRMSEGQSQAQIAGLTGQLEQSMKNIAELKRSEEELRKQLKESETEQNKLKNDLVSISESTSADVKANRDVTEKYKAEIESLKNSLQETRNMLDNKKYECDSLKNVSEAAESDFNAKLKKAETEASITNKKYEITLKQRDKLEEAVENMRREMSSLEEELKDAFAQLKHQRKEAEGLQKKIQLQEEIIRFKTAEQERGDIKLPLSNRIRLVLKGFSLSVRNFFTEINQPNQSHKRKYITAIATVIIVAGFIMAIIAALPTIRSQSVNRAKQQKEEKNITRPTYAMDPVAPDQVLDNEDQEQDLEWPEIAVNKTSVEYSDNYCIIKFDNGLFASGTNLTESAHAVLKQTADCLKGSITNFSIVVEGHTASQKAEYTAKAQDNFALGMARANTVLKLLNTKYALPKDALLATSAGETDPPFSGTDAATLSKNKTVVLKLTPRTRK